jgi:hypothetical protein
MFARVHTLETGPDEYERGYAMVRDVLLPWARESTGFCGLIGLVDEDRQESLVITLWADEESLEASASAGDNLGDLAATASGATRASLKAYAVSIFDVPGRRPSQLPEPLGGEPAPPPQVH